MKNTNKNKTNQMINQKENDFRSRIEISKE